MKKYYHNNDIRRADIIAVEKYGVPSIVLMENAGTNAANAILSLYPGAENILIFAGAGNNGGDGFVVARRLCDAGKRVSVITTLSDEKYKGDALINLSKLRSMGCSTVSIITSAGIDDINIHKFIAQSDVVIDALLGTGSQGAPRKETARLIPMINKARVRVALDIPSGMDPESGLIQDTAVSADLTITFLALKLGMTNYFARKLCGRIEVVGIGVEPSLVLPKIDFIEGYDKSDALNLLPHIDRDIHKGDRGGVLICGGSMSYRGAPILSALGALRSGAGLVVMAIPDFMVQMGSTLVPEAIVLPLKTENGLVLANDAITAITAWTSRCGSAVFGTGCGRDDSMRDILRFLWNGCSLPLLVDADGLFHLAQMSDELRTRDNTIITPHVGEAARLLGSSQQSVAAERLSAVRSLSKYSEAALLKGRGTLIASGARVGEILDGSPALAVPGSGDVLSGAIGAFSASGLGSFDSAVVGAAIHAAAGFSIEKKHGLRGTFAREIADEIRNELREQL